MHEDKETDKLMQLQGHKTADNRGFTLLFELVGYLENYGTEKYSGFQSLQKLETLEYILF